MLRRAWHGWMVNAHVQHEMLLTRQHEDAMAEQQQELRAAAMRRATICHRVGIFGPRVLGFSRPIWPFPFTAHGWLVAVSLWIVYFVPWFLGYLSIHMSLSILSSILQVN